MKGVDHVGDAQDLSRFDDGTFDKVYVSHTLEHFDFTGPLQKALKEWYRILKDDGRLYISVPDMDVLCGLFLKKDLVDIQKRVKVMQMMFGGHCNKYDYHYVGFDFYILSGLLKTAGFAKVERVGNFDMFRDCSTIAFCGVPISLNVIATK